MEERREKERDQQARINFKKQTETRPKHTRPDPNRAENNESPSKRRSPPTDPRKESNRKNLLLCLGNKFVKIIEILKPDRRMEDA